ncbi:MAG: hypothetical protein A2452_09580 [Candidatus Firestonebacteria bacterium RIFOXYC2_FULL_39_67]|nr:MAG: hypothetical protein A2536_09740 [Candidatus Firestonebacteria bacterium RIFOXYD2_FULL_39_29]OGF54809.1 MAG: hypothetical protein A2497_07585 [Candidatus Firestonebacteria bacterium RifOxyC12_full_39_7]OGF55254.1 MAG: hypothetical protein A2452_09580 [Candidatus Firestonebacteria bacterium RIFOXYC2_FULL_39_67]
MLKAILSLLTLLVLPVFCASQGFSLDVYSEKAEVASKEIMKEVTWSSVKTREELLLEYIIGKDNTDPLKLFYCSKQIIQKREESVPEIVKLLAVTENEEKFAGLALPLLYSKDRRVVELLKIIIENKTKSIKMRGLSAAILATYVKNEAYAKNKWKIAKQVVYTSEFLRLEKDEIKNLLLYVDELKFRKDIGVDMFIWIKPGIYDFTQPVEDPDLLKDKDKKEKKEDVMKDLKSDNKDKRENAIYSMLNLPFAGRDKLLEGISRSDPDTGIRKSAELYLKLIERLKAEKTVITPEVKKAPGKQEKD